MQREDDETNPVCLACQAPLKGAFCDQCGRKSHVAQELAVRYGSGDVAPREQGLRGFLSAVAVTTLVAPRKHLLAFVAVTSVFLGLALGFAPIELSPAASVFLSYVVFGLALVVFHLLFTRRRLGNSRDK